MKRLLALGIDAVLVVVFAALGRASHAEPLALDGLTRTAMPFLGGLLIAWIVLARLGANGFALRDGVVAWALTVAMGMILRLMIGDTAAWSFVLVAAAVLAAFLLGWRLVLLLVARYAPGGADLSMALTGSPRPTSTRRGAPVKNPRRSGNPAVRASGRRSK